MNENSNQRSLQLLGVAAAIFALTLAIFYAIGFVPDYVDGTSEENAAKKVAEAGVPQLQGLPGKTYLVPLNQLLVPVAVQPVASATYTAGESSVSNTQTPTQNQNTTVQNTSQTGNTVPSSSALPTRIVIPKIGKNLPINNPSATDVAALDTSLLSGVVRYPLSAKLNQTGTIFIFGHSSHLPVVQNKMFQAFNDIETLKAGDTLEVQGSGHTYIYTVDVVRKADAAEDYVDLESHGEQRLILSTCDSFGKKTTRWIVEATLASVE